MIIDVLFRRLFFLLYKLCRSSGKRVDSMDKNEDGKVEHPSFGNVSTSFPAAFISHLILELPSRIS